MAHATAYRLVSVVRIADHLYQLAQRDNRVSISHLAPEDRRPYEQAANTALNVLDTLLEHAAEERERLSRPDAVALMSRVAEVLS